MYYLVTYNYNGEMKDVAISCIYEDLAECVIKQAKFFFPSFSAYGLIMREGILRGKEGEILFNIRKIDNIYIKENK